MSCTTRAGPARFSQGKTATHPSWSKAPARQSPANAPNITGPWAPGHNVRWGQTAPVVVGWEREVRKLEEHSAHLPFLLTVYLSVKIATYELIKFCYKLRRYLEKGLTSKKWVSRKTVLKVLKITCELFIVIVNYWLF